MPFSSSCDGQGRVEQRVVDHLGDVVRRCSPCSISRKRMTKDMTSNLSDYSNLLLLIRIILLIRCYI